MDPPVGVPKGAAKLRVRGVEKYREFETASAITVKVVLTHNVEKLCPDTYSLPLGHYHKACRPVCLGREQRRDRKMTHRFAIDDAYKVFCGHREREV